MIGWIKRHPIETAALVFGAAWLWVSSFDFKLSMAGSEPPTVVKGDRFTSTDPQTGLIHSFLAIDVTDAMVIYAEQELAGVIRIVPRKNVIRLMLQGEAPQ